MKEKINWSKVRAGRDQASRTLGKCLSIPLVKSSADLLLQLIPDNSAVLDMGANDRNVERLFISAKRRIEYRSFDIDDTYVHDYYEISKISGKFDFVVILEVIEHLTPTEVMQLFEQTKTLLNPGGTIVVSTPNVCHPTRLWRDCTHITPFRYDELAGFLYSSDFRDVKVFRIKHMRTKDWLRYYFSLPMLRLLDIDFAPGIVAIATTTAS